MTDAEWDRQIDAELERRRLHAATLAEVVAVGIQRAELYANQEAS